MSEPSQGGFVTARANLERARASLPVAALPYEADAHVREYPDIPNTRAATIRVDGQALVPHFGAISYESSSWKNRIIPSTPTVGGDVAHGERTRMA